MGGWAARRSPELAAGYPANFHLVGSEVSSQRHAGATGDAKAERKSSFACRLGKEVFVRSDYIIHLPR